MAKKQVYIIEHLEKHVYKWCFFEYEHISELVGRENLWFTNIKRKNRKLEAIGRCFKESVRDLKLDKKEVCILDPETDKTLEPKESEEFKYFIFGGILGDYPPRKRTKEELTRFLSGEIRNIGKNQMSTDNAVFTVWRIAHGANFKDLKFEDNLTLELGKFQKLDLPYRYNLVDGKPYMSSELLGFLKRKKGF
jgi:ribosome biogenesis SPOUT family RNA methylase Rps3